jgi:hypothetical protein
MVGSVPGFSSIYPSLGHVAADKKCGLVGGYREKKNPFEIFCGGLTHILKILAKKKGLETNLLFTELLLINFAY